MTQKNIKNPIEDFSKEEIKKKDLIKGGPDTSRGTETEVQEDD